MSVLIATAPTDKPVNAYIAVVLATTFTELTEKGGNCAEGTFPSVPKLATPLTAPIKLLLIFKSKAFCVAVLIGLLKSEVLLTRFKPRADKAPA